MHARTSTDRHIQAQPGKDTHTQGHTIIDRHIQLQTSTDRHRPTHIDTDRLSEDGSGPGRGTSAGYKITDGHCVSPTGNPTKGKDLEEDRRDGGETN